MYVQRFENDEEPKPSVSVNHRTTLHLVGEKLDYHGILHSVTGVLTELAINIYFVSQPDKTKAIIL